MPKINSLNKLEYRVRFWFSKRPIFYGLIGGVGVVLFWRGVWHTADSSQGQLLQQHYPWARLEWS